MITVIGMDGSPLTSRAEAAIAAATLVVGGHRHLSSTATGNGAQAVALGELAPALDALASHRGDAVVLASGDPGFFGIVRSLRGRGLDFTVLPGVSSVSLAFARAGLSWDDAVVVSAHGRGLRQAVNVCRAHRKVAVLTGPGAGPAEIGAALAGWQRQMIICERLGTDRERVTECRPADAERQTWADPSVVLVLAAGTASTWAAANGDGTAGVPAGREKGAPASGLEAGTVSRAMAGAAAAGAAAAGAAAAGAATAGAATAERRPVGEREVGEGTADGGAAGAAAGNGPGWVWPSPGVATGWALAEEDFDTRDAVITKAEVRSLALARLAPGPGTLVWDVGAGTGSVGVECARFGAAVVAVERDGQRCTRIQANARRHGVDVRVVNAEAQKALADLPEPDAVFIGGGGTEVIESVVTRRPARIVVALAAIERAGQARAALATAGYQVDGVLLQAARFAPLPGDVHRLASINPVFLLWAAPAASSQQDDQGGPR